MSHAVGMGGKVCEMTLLRIVTLYPLEFTNDLQKGQNLRQRRWCLGSNVYRLLRLKQNLIRFSIWPWSSIAEPIKSSIKGASSQTPVTTCPYPLQVKFSWTGKKTRILYWPSPIKCYDQPKKFMGQLRPIHYCRSWHSKARLIEEWWCMCVMSLQNSTYDCSQVP